MKCYVCAKDGKGMEAVAVCAECGMGLCMEHAKYHRIPAIPRGMLQVKRPPMIILCETCAEALFTSA